MYVVVKVKHIRDRGGWQEGSVCRLLIISLLPRLHVLYPTYWYSVLLAADAKPFLAPWQLRQGW
jgi:hypothetical protein